MGPQEHKENIEKFKGFRSPKYTQVPDEIFDLLLPLLSGAELKVLLYICRRTFGFKRDYDAISLIQISGGIKTRDGRVLDTGTGLSKRHIQRAIKRLEELHAVRVIRKLDDDGVNEVNIYTLNFMDEGVGTKSPYGRDMGDTRVGTPVSPTIYSKQDTDNNVNVDKEGKGSGGTEEPKTDLHKLPNLDQDKPKTEFIANEILHQLGDRQSLPFYYLVASKVPEQEIYAALSSIKQSGANSPPKVFTNRMKNYAAQKADTRSQSLHSAMQEIQKKMTLR